MKASTWEYRLRAWILLAIYVLGFAAPWDLAWRLDGSGPNTHVWARLAMLLFKNGAVGVGTAFNLVLVAGIACATLGAWLRTWGGAYLGRGVVSDGNLRGDSVVADGPYRYVRNPLYLGLWVFSLALALLMRPSGAAFTVVAVAVFCLRLIFAEEAFLRTNLAEPYAAYCARVPRLLPAPNPRVAATGAKPQWLRAAAAEIFLWGVALSYAVLGWRYDAHLLLRCVLICFGVELIERALRRDPTPKPEILQR